MQGAVPRGASAGFEETGDSLYKESPFCMGFSALREGLRLNETGAGMAASPVAPLYKARRARYNKRVKA